MSAPAYPPPEATSAEVAVWHEEQKRRERIRRGLKRGVRYRCHLCGGRGHVPGDPKWCRRQDSVTRDEVVAALGGKS